MEKSPLSQRLASGALDEQLVRLYGPGRLTHEKDRYGYVLDKFARTFGRPADKKRKLYNGMLKCDLFMYL